MSVTRIAEKAGVSIATVSRVLNNSRNVDPVLAESVRQAARDLQIQAKPRQKQRTTTPKARRTIAVVTLGQSAAGWFGVPVMASILSGISRAAHDTDVGMIVTEMPDPLEIGPDLRRPGVDGAIVLIGGGRGMADLAALQKQLPVVRIMGNQSGPLLADYVDADNNEIGRLAASHLLGLGLKRLAYLSERPMWDMVRVRALGFMVTACAAGVVPEIYGLAMNTPHPFYGPGYIAGPSVEALVVRMAIAGERPFGLFVPRDEETVSVYRLLRAQGLEPGRDVVVVSCDNEQVRLGALDPRPATIELGTADIARHAFGRLIARMDGLDEPPVRTLVTPTLVPAAVAATG